MEYNVAKERIKFFTEQDRLAKEYRKAGMTEEQIKVMFDYDYEVFKKERAFREHNNFMDLEAFEEECVLEDRAGVMDSFPDRFSTDLTYLNPWERYGWVERIEDPELYGSLKGLPESDLELITLYAMEGYLMKEIAEMLGISRQAVGKRIQKLKKFIKK